MPRITFYISEEDKKTWYEKFKEQIGESASSFHVDAIKKYVIAKEREQKGLTDIILPVGEVNMDAETSNVKHVKFVGKFIAEGTAQDPKDTVVKYQVYLTRKDKLLVYRDSNTDNVFITFSYKVFDSQSDFFKANYPVGLANEVLKNLPNVPYEELDI